MLNKLKNIFMAKEKELEPIGTLPPDWEPKEETSPDHLKESPEAVGFSSEQEQWDLYYDIANYIPEGESVLDFGCARGDFKSFHNSQFKSDIDYIGIDMNQHLIDVGIEKYDGTIDLRCIQWESLPDDLSQDWCINIGSSNLRYDANIKLSDDEYLKDTIRIMYKHANKGVVLLLTSNLLETDDGLINRSPSDILNWALKEFGSVALDHSFSDDVFILVIYK